MKKLILLCLLLLAVSITAAEFPGAPYIVRGAALTLIHSIQPQAPGMTPDAKVVLTSKPQQSPAFTAELKHGQEAFIGAAVMPKDKYFNFAGHTVLSCDVRNDSPYPMDVLLRIHSGPEVTKPTGRPEVGVYLMPGETKTLKVPLYAFRKDSKIQLMEKEYMQAKPFGMVSHPGLDAEHVTALIFWSMTPYLKRDSGSSRFSVSRFRFTDELAPNKAPLNDPAKFFPMIDRYGQYRHVEYPGKIHSDDELREYAKKEAASWKPRPADWNKYGGYNPGPTLKATGFFRTEKYNGKWYLVDPEGKLFFSLGISSITWWHGEHASGRDHYFERRPEYAPAVNRTVLRHIKEGSIIQWGTGFPYKVFEKRLDSWGVNTMGVWCNPDMMKKWKRPYTPVIMHFRKEGTFGHGARDGFDPAYANALRHEMTTNLGWTLNDPMCIGYFVTNEIYFGPEGTWAAQIMLKPASQPGKIVFRDFLKKRYGTVARLNKAWGKKYQSFDQFLTDPKAPVTPAGKQDLTEFSAILIKKFFEVSRKVIKECAPNHLFMGNRFQMSAGASYGYLAKLFPEYVDVASYNCYWLGLDHFAPQIPDLPVIISEFNIGGVEARGHFASGLAVSGFTPEERGEALRRYYESALRNPRIVGMCYFQFVEQPVCGRPGDGENLSLGVLDTTGRPYPEVVNTMRIVADEAIPYRMKN